jgi:hypothetical protein
MEIKRERREREDKEVAGRGQKTEDRNSAVGNKLTNSLIL